MSRFSDLLSDAASRLTVPEPARSRILLEVSSDMEDLHQAYLDRGLSQEEARKAVVEQFDLSDEVLKELTRVHASPLQRSLETLSGPVRGTWARVLLALTALFFLLGSGRVLLMGRLYRDASTLVWVILPLLLLGLAVGVWKFYRLFLSGVPWSPGLRKGTGYLLGLALLEILLTLGGHWVELYRSFLLIRLAPGDVLIHLAGWLHEASATLVVSLSGALFLGFLWFFLETRAQQMEQAAAARLLEVSP